MSAPKPRRRWSMLRFSLRSLLIAMTLICIGIVAKQQYDWWRMRQLIHQWIAPLVERAEAAGGDVMKYEDSQLTLVTPEGMSSDEELAILRYSILELEKPVERVAALKILVESRGSAALPVLRELAGRTKDRELQALLIHLISLDRNADDLAAFERLLDHESSAIRAAAAEAIGFIKCPSYGFSHDVGLPFSAGRSNSLPPIALAVLSEQVDNISPMSSMQRKTLEAVRQSKIPASFRERLERVMLQGVTQEERTAAARALVAWPSTGYSLRLAEWGVWIDDQENHLLAASVLAENPAFVHAIGNARQSLPVNRDGIWRFVVTKPILHLTADRPLAVDVEVAFEDGRPWFAFPRPDIITRHGGVPKSRRPGMLSEPKFDLKDLPEIEPQGLASLASGSEGYPWLHPADRNSDMRWGYSARFHANAMGLRWQSLIVAPQRPPWASVPEVPSDPKFRWWQQLRDVPSSWVTSQDETERFLYYDGPIKANAPVIATWSGDKLTLRGQEMLPKRDDGFVREVSRAPAPHDCLLIEVVTGRLRALQVQAPAQGDPERTIDLAAMPWQNGEAVESTFLEVLQTRGLTQQEAGGLINSWRDRFFQSPGKRLLTFLTPEDYNRMCPLEVRPPPTATVRVGIVLREFGE